MVEILIYLNAFHPDASNIIYWIFVGGWLLDEILKVIRGDGSGLWKFYSSILYIPSGSECSPDVEATLEFSRWESQKRSAKSYGTLLESHNRENWLARNQAACRCWMLDRKTNIMSRACWNQNFYNIMSIDRLVVQALCIKTDRAVAKCAEVKRVQHSKRYAVLLKLTYRTIFPTQIWTDK